MDARNSHAKQKALRHPLRRQITDIVTERGKTSPKELSHLLEHPLSNVAYHVRVLADVEILKMIDTRPVRGSVQHFYVVA